MTNTNLSCFGGVERSFYGLILTGGYSQRMGKDKSSLEYHGKAQRLFLWELLQEFCEEVFISCRKEQAEEWQDELNYLVDNYENIGPLAGILTAFETKPDTTWLVLACDLPFVNRQNIQYLLENRDTKQYATAYYNPNMQSPEPLLAIWEAKSYEIIKNSFEKGFYSPQKILQKLAVHLIYPMDAHDLMNVNDMQTYQEIMEKIKAK